MSTIVDLKDIVKGYIGYNEPMSFHTTFRIGGPVQVWVEPLSVEELFEIVEYCIHQGVLYRVIGNGSNVLVDSSGIKGVVINLCNLQKIEMVERKIIVGGGVSLSRLVNFCIEYGLSGLEFMTGIPATIGGAVRMNAGANGMKVGDKVEELLVLKEGKLVRMSQKEMEFGYKRSSISRGDVIIEASFTLDWMDSDEIRESVMDILKVRKRKYPPGYSAGCVFKNPPYMSAGKLIEEVGLKGLKVGGAYVSKIHANFIINDGTATSEDVLRLIDIVRERVDKEKGVELELEIEYWK